MPPDSPAPAPPAPAIWDEMVDGQGRVRPAWRGVAALLASLPEGGLAARAVRLDRALAEDGVAALLPSERASGTVEPPWRCDPVPLVLGAAEFARLAAGVAQRARLIAAVLEDLYGAQRLLARGLIAPGPVFADPAFLRPCRAPPLPGPHLTMLACDLVRGPDGAWRVVADRPGVPEGAGLARENRRLLASLAPEAFRFARVRELRPFFEAWADALQRAAVAANPRIALLTAGTAHEAWFEHVLLARDLGCVLVEGADLTARDGRVFLKTLKGLMPIDVILRGVEGRLVDPLELAPDSLIGVAGLLDAARSGGVRILNAPGTDLAAAPAIAAALPKLAEHLLGEALALPGLGSAAAIAPSVTPTFDGTGLVPRPFALRLFALRDAGGAWRVMPGGLARVLEAGADPARGLAERGVAKDVWVLAEDEADLIGPPALAAPPLAIRRASAELPSRVADDLYWLGRYVERLENAARLIRAVLIRLGRGSLLPRDLAELRALAACLAEAGVIAAEVAAAPPDGALLPRALLAACRPHHALPDLFERIGRLARAVRDRFTADMWATLAHLSGEARGALDRAGRDAEMLAEATAAALRFSAGLAGIAAENMVRGGGWMFLDLGRRIERAANTARDLARVLDLPPARIDSGLVLALELCDSVITYRSRYLAALQPAPVLDLVLADPTNPRAIAFQFAQIVERLSEVQGLPEGDLAQASRGLRAEVEAMVERVAASAEPAVEAVLLPKALRGIAERTGALSDAIARRYFSHVPASRRVGFGAESEEPMG
ncbi:MAG: circularly permuted type 2 ATP-grasp protein [Acetobacteraceae bacterium]|nr:circularly permuted type 2 ATP-grasp protein [Acetobacteraceae bacterium]